MALILPFISHFELFFFAFAEVLVIYFACANCTNWNLNGTLQRTQKMTETITKWNKATALSSAESSVLETSKWNLNCSFGGSWTNEKKFNDESWNEWLWVFLKAGIEGWTQGDDCCRNTNNQSMLNLTFNPFVPWSFLKIVIDIFIREIDFHWRSSFLFLILRFCFS